MLRPAAFLDRDGTVNEDVGYLHRPGDFRYLDGAVEGMRRLRALGYALVVVTNQSGIARGYYTEEDYRRLTGWMLADLEGRGVRMDGVYCCPHHPEGTVARYAADCNCRKPRTGLFHLAAAELGIDLDRSIAVGDHPRDLAICRETGARGFLLSDGADAEHWCSCRDWGEVVRRAGEARAEGPWGRQKGRGSGNDAS